jgi:hypothetical protein
MKMMNAAAGESLRLMNDLLRRKLNILQNMHGISAQSVNYVGETGFEALSNIVDLKQSLIRDIDYLDNLFLSEFGKLKSGMGIKTLDELNGAGQPGLAELRTQTAKILELLYNIGSLDKIFNDELLKLRDVISADLNRIKKQKRVSEQYDSDAAGGRLKGPADYPPASFFDAKK